jgi:hypothetical protein
VYERERRQNHAKASDERGEAGLPVTGSSFVVGTRSPGEGIGSRTELDAWRCGASTRYRRDGRCTWWRASTVCALQPRAGR